MNKTSAFDFIRSSDRNIGLTLQREIIAIDIELSLKNGIRPEIDDYQWQFPVLKGELRQLFADTIEQHVNVHCPIRYTLGSLPFINKAYEILGETGRGGMGVVYEARQISVDRKVAIKVLFFSREEIALEARSLASIEHPNICRVYGTDQLYGLSVMVMQFLDGMQLGKWIKENPETPLHQSVEIIGKLALAVSAAHKSGITHLDIKPSNIMMSARSEPTLVDFGLACKHADYQPAFLGSPSFLAPEQLDASVSVDPKLCDIYSLGAVLYELLTGRRAFHGQVENVINQVRNDPPRRPSDYRSDIDEVLEQICLKAMSKTPSARFQSMQEFHQALADWQSQNK